MVEQFHGVPERVGQLQRHDGRAPASAAGRYAPGGRFVGRPRPLFRPVEKIPVGHLPQHPGVRVDFPLVPAEHRFEYRQVAAHEVRVVAVHPVVVQAVDPVERKRRDDLIDFRRIAAAQDAFLGHRRGNVVDRAAHQAVVSADIQRNEALNTRVAHVLHLLVVRTVVVGFARAQPGGPPSGFPDFRQFGVVGAEIAVLTEWVAREFRIPAVDGQPFVRRFDLHLDVSVAAEPQRTERAARLPVGIEHVRESPDVLPFDFVAVALLPVVDVHGFGIGQRYFRAFASADGQGGVGVGQVLLVEQQRRPRAGRYGQRFVLFEIVVRVDPFAAPDDRGVLGAALHQRYRARNERPDLAATGQRGTAGFGLYGRRPAGIVVAGLFPTPRVAVSVHDKARFHVLQVDERRGQRAVVTAFPRRVGINRAFAFRFALDDQPGAQRNLRPARPPSVIPYGRGDDVVALFQVRRDVQRFVAPVLQRAARRSAVHAAAVDEQLVTGIGRDVDDETGRNPLQRECFPEAIRFEFAFRHLAGGDPTGVPNCFLPAVGRGDRFGFVGEGCRRGEDRRQQE